MLPDSFTFAGISFGCVNRATAASEVAALALGERPSYVCVTGAHGVVEAARDGDFRTILQGATLVTPDGTPLAWFARLKGHAHVTRVTGWELIHDTIIMAPRVPLRHFFYGSTPEVTEKITNRLSALQPEALICGADNPPFRPLTAEEIDELIAVLRAAGANVVWIGLSTPRQEVLAREVAHRLGRGVVVASGAGFDFIAGTKPIAPHWITALGLEWLYRLAHEPQRLARRYADVVPRFLMLFAREAFRR